MTGERIRAAAPALAITLIGLTSLAWFRGDFSAVAGYDFALSLKPADDLGRSFYLWDDRLYAGSPNTLSIGVMPYFLLQWLFEQAAGSLYRGQMLLFALLFTLPGLAMLWYLSGVFSPERARHAPFFGALCYMLNAFVIIKWNRGELLTLFAYGMLPLMLGLVHRGLGMPLSTRFLLLFLAAVFFYPVCIGHPADFLIVSALVAAYAAWRLLAAGTAEAYRRSAVLSLVAVGASAWWLIPVGYLAAGGSSVSFSAGEEPMALVDYYSSWSTLLRHFKMWSFSMYATAVEFKEQFYRPGTLLIPILAFSALLFRRSGHVLFFAAAALAGLWLSKGTAEPLPGAYRWLYENVPFFFIFRAPSRYFPILYTLSISVLFGYFAACSIAAVRSLLPGRRAHLAVAAALSALVLFHAWPLFSRQTLFRSTPGDTLYPSVFVSIPAYYEQMNAWLKNRADGSRVHSFPTEAYLNYTWGYSSTDVMPRLVESPQTLKFSQELVLGSEGFHSLMDSFASSFWAWQFDGADRFLGMLGARYIAVVDDVMRRYLPELNYYEVLDRALGRMSGLRPAASFAEARLYENSFAAPRVWASRKALAVEGGAPEVMDLSRAGFLDKPALTQGSRSADLPQGVSGRIAFVDKGRQYAGPEHRRGLTLVHRAEDGDAIALPAGELLVRAAPNGRAESMRVAAYSRDFASGAGIAGWIPSKGTVSARPDGALLSSATGGTEAAAFFAFPERLDLERFPRFEVSGHGLGNAGHKVSVAFGLDLDADGWVDDELEVSMNDGAGGVDRLLKHRYGFPGRPGYHALWAAVKAEREDGGMASFVVSGVEFYQAVPGQSAAPVLELDGKALPAGASTLRAAGRSVLKIRGGSALVAVSQAPQAGESELPAPEVSFERVSPVHYRVRARAVAGSPFWLIFNESYSDGWVAYSSGRRGLIPWSGGEQAWEHRMANGFANAWHVKSPEDEMDITIEYAPQRLATAGAAISLSVFAAALVFLPAIRRGRHGR